MKAVTKYEVIYCRREKYPIQIMCKFFGVSRSGYYGYVRRRGLLPRNTELAGFIAECQKSCGKTYGYRRVQIWLERKKSLHLNPKTILHIMNKYGLLSEIRRLKKYRQMGQQLHKYENILNRNFVADRPNAKWVTDISYIHTTQGVLYLSMIRDLFDNSIVAYKTGTEQTVNLVLNTIKACYGKRNSRRGVAPPQRPGVSIHLTSIFNLTKDYGITPSMSRRGNCYDNALAENFFSILKTECIYRRKLSSFDEARQLIDEYIDFYNNERIQTKTHLTPLEKRRQVA